MLLAELVSYSKAQQRQLVVYLQLSEQSACLNIIGHESKATYIGILIRQADYSDS